MPNLPDHHEISQLDPEKFEIMECDGVLISMPRDRRCYQCDGLVAYLFDDGRCSRCIRLTPEEVSL